MRRAGALPIRALFLIGLALLSWVGCGRREQAPPANGDGLSFEKLADTTGLSDGPPIVETFDVRRLPGGSLQVMARLGFPPGTRVQVAIRKPGQQAAVAMTQSIVEADHTFATPPMMSPQGPLPIAPYQFELSAQFTPEWQTADVLRATDDGRALRGPGITRTGIGGAIFQVVQEMTR